MKETASKRYPEMADEVDQLLATVNNKKWSSVWELFDTSENRLEAERILKMVRVLTDKR